MSVVLSLYRVVKADTGSASKQKDLDSQSSKKSFDDMLVLKSPNSSVRVQIG